MDRDRELKQWFSVAAEDTNSALQYAQEIRNFVMATKSSANDEY
jgi:hypothetical protein